jgi:subtilase family serine protease
MNLSNIGRLLVFSALTAASIYAQVGGYAVMPTADPGSARSHAWVAAVTPDLTVSHGPGQNCGVSETVVCYYNPADLQTAYAVNSIAHSNGGAGITVAIVDAYYNSQTEADLATYSSAFGLPACSVASGCLTIVSQTGAVCTVMPTPCSTSATFNGEGWALETDLDVEAVHAMAPNAHILLVTATSDSNVNLFTAVAYAYAHADVVTDSWGENEFSGETAAESVFSASTVPILFSAGDAGAVAEYPCMSAYTVCVGGTKLLVTATSFRKAESAWGTDSQGGGGGGCSAYISAPAWQSGFSTSACGSARGAPDIAAVADEYTGMNTYLGSFAALGLSSSCTPTLCPAGGYVIGGTSLASPLMAGLVALIDADRVYNGHSKLGSNMAHSLYTGAGTSYRYRYYDVTTGSTGFAAGTGWDRATGLGVVLGPAFAVWYLTQP